MEPPTRRMLLVLDKAARGCATKPVARTRRRRVRLKNSGLNRLIRWRGDASLICAPASALDIDGEQSWSMAGRPRACARSLPMCSVGAGGSAVAIAAVHGQRRCMECHAHRVVLSAHVTLLLGA